MLDSERMQYMVDGLSTEMATMVLPFMGQRDYTCEDFFRQIRVQTDLSERKIANKRSVSSTEGARLTVPGKEKKNMLAKNWMIYGRKYKNWRILGRTIVGATDQSWRCLLLKL